MILDLQIEARPTAAQPCEAYMQFFKMNVIISRISTHWMMNIFLRSASISALIMSKFLKAILLYGLSLTLRDRHWRAAP